MASEYSTLMAIERNGDLNPAQRTRLEELKASGAIDEDAPFSFDYEAEAKKAYGELGSYYDRLLKEAQGDMNKVLSRLVEDYERGKRVRTEDYNQALTNANQAAINSAQRRGIYNRSAYDPGGGFGLADALIAKVRQPVEQSFTRANEAADIAKSRTEADTAEAMQRKQFEMEQQRRTQAAGMANERGSRAYSKWSATSLI